MEISLADTIGVGVPAQVRGLLPRLSDTPGTVRSLGPKLGEHNDDVYRGLPGLGEDEIASLAGNAVIQRSLTRCSGCRTRASVTFDPKGAKAIMVLSTLQADGYTQSR